MLDRTAVPAFKKPEIFTLPKIDSGKLSNGIPYFEVSLGSQEAIKVDLVFNGGHIHEPANGVSYFTSKLLTGGAKTKSAANIEESFATYGAFIEISSGYDQVVVTVYCLEKFLKEVLSLVNELIHQSILPDSELQNLKNIQLQNIRVNKEKTSFLAAVQMRSSFYQKGHPYGRIVDEEAVKDIDSFVLKSYFPVLFSFSSCAIFVSGGGKDCFNIVESVFGQNTVSTNSLQDNIIAPVQYQSNKLHIDRTDALQSSIRLAIPAVPFSHPDYAALALSNELLGGYFGSRLMKNIREDKGYTYGIHSALINLQSASYWACQTDVKKEVLGDTLEEIWKEIHILQQEAVSADELETVKNYMLGGYLNSLNTPFAIMEKFKVLYFHKLPVTFYEDLFVRINQISEADIANTCQQYFTEDKLMQSTVG
jgi:zinc protease